MSRQYGAAAGARWLGARKFSPTAALIMRSHNSFITPLPRFYTRPHSLACFNVHTTVYSSTASFHTGLYYLSQSARPALAPPAGLLFCLQCTRPESNCETRGHRQSNVAVSVGQTPCPKSKQLRVGLVPGPAENCILIASTSSRPTPASAPILVLLHLRHYHLRRPFEPLSPTCLLSATTPPLIELVLKIVALKYTYGAQAPLLVPSVFSTSPPLPSAVLLSLATPLQSFASSPALSPSPTTLLSHHGSDSAVYVVVDDEPLALPLDYKHLGRPEEAKDRPRSTASFTNVSADQEPMKAVKTKAAIGVLSTLVSYVSLNSLYKSLNPEAFVWYAEDRDEESWLASSSSWLDRKACRWLGICGLAHMRPVGPRFGHRPERSHQTPFPGDDNDWDWHSAWSEGNGRPGDWDDDERLLREIPEYVMEYAPLVHLFSGEQFWPCDIAEHLVHITPTLNYTPVQPRWQHPTLGDLDELNQWDYGKYVFLTSNDNVEERPGWLEGEKNIPVRLPGNATLEDYFGLHYEGTYSRDLTGDFSDNDGHWNSASNDGNSREPDGVAPILAVKSAVVAASTSGGLSSDGYEPHVVPDLKRHKDGSLRHRRPKGGRSRAPAVLVTVDKGHGVVDAFWFFFYSFNLGNIVFNVRFGNHVGDWEHTMIRFQHGKPRAVFFSEHDFGSAYSYEAVEKYGRRPVIYSAIGTHAMYPTPGSHAYVLPWGLLHDETDRGPLWDPSLNVHSYNYDYKEDTLRSSMLTPKAPTEWFFFHGHWGDKFYPLGDSRQYRFAGQYHYVNGPLGPRFKNLGRKKVCQGPNSEPCVIKHWLGESNRLRRWHGPGEGEQMSDDDFQKLALRNASDLTEGLA